MQLRPRLVAGVFVPLLVAGALGVTFGRSLLDDPGSGTRAATLTPVPPDPTDSGIGALDESDTAEEDGAGEDSTSADEESQAPSEKDEGEASGEEKSSGAKDEKKEKKEKKAKKDEARKAEKAARKGSTSFTAQVIRLTNAERAKRGCKALSSDRELEAAAQAHSRDMAKHDYFAHDSRDGRSPFDRMAEAGYEYSAAAENIAAGQRSPADVVKGWMDSKGHRANILNCTYTEIGVGYAKGGSYGTYWTQNFGKPA